jgi:hypothetical protein
MGRSYAEVFRPMGSVSRLSIESQALKSNLLGNPMVRVVEVYIPGHDGQGPPLPVDLVGFTSSALHPRQHQPLVIDQSYPK